MRYKSTLIVKANTLLKRKTKLVLKKWFVVDKIIVKFFEHYFEKKKALNKFSNLAFKFIFVFCIGSVSSFGFIKCLTTTSL